MILLISDLSNFEVIFVLGLIWMSLTLITTKKWSLTLDEVTEKSYEHKKFDTKMLVPDHSTNRDLNSVLNMNGIQSSGFDSPSNQHRSAQNTPDKEFITHTQEEIEHKITKK